MTPRYFFFSIKQWDAIRDSESMSDLILKNFYFMLEYVRVLTA